MAAMLRGWSPRALGGSELHVTLKSPPPLDSDLTLETDGAAGDTFQDDSIVVTASREPLDIDVLLAPTLAEAQDAEPRFTGHSHHIFPGCFVCGPERERRRRDAHLPGRASRSSPSRRRDLDPGRYASPTTTASSGPNSCGRRSTALAISPPGPMPEWRCSAKCRPSSIARLGPASL